MHLFPSAFDRPGFRRGPLPRRAITAILTLGVLLTTVAAGYAVQQTSVSAPSPATGSARVVAQGVVAIPTGDVVWRTVRYEALPRDRAEIVARPLSFLIASDGPLFLANVDPLTGLLGSIPDTRLASGETVLVQADAQHQRASVGNEPTNYIALELVPSSLASVLDSGELLFVSEPFAPSGTTADLNVDLDLVSAVLGDGDTTVIPDSGQAVAILATDGAIEVIPSGGRRRTLQVGEGDVFTGEIDIRPAASTEGNAKQLIATQDAPSGGATYMAAVIGPEIPPLASAQPQSVEPNVVPTVADIVDTPTPLAAPTETATPIPTATPTETPTPTPIVEPTWTPTPDLDSDQDGLGDSLESQYGTNTTLPDTDGDWLTDGEEVWVYGTLPTNPNTDDDGCTDGYEVTEGFNPFAPDCYIIE